MLDFDDSTLEPPRRRSTDLPEPTAPITALDAWQRAGLAHKRLHEFELELLALRRAFLKDDLGTPDYEGHRGAHKSMVEASKVVDGYKQDVTKKIMGGGALFLLSALFVGLISWLKDHIK